jgi:hypothetical protein
MQKERFFMIKLSVKDAKRKILRDKTFGKGCKNKA